MKRLRQDRAALGMVTRENLLTEEENPYWDDDSETSLHADQIMGRPEEVVLVTRTGEESAALRGWGALAVARHHAGWWCAVSRHALAKRDVVFVGARAGSELGWAEEDGHVLAGTVGRVGVLVPEGCSGEAPAADLVEYVARERARGQGLEGLIAEARATLKEPPAPAVAEAEAEDRTGGWPPGRLTV